MVFSKPHILVAFLILSSISTAFPLHSEAQFDKEIRMRTIVLPKELLPETESMDMFLEEMRAVEEMIHANEWDIQHIPESYQARYNKFQALVRSASAREETLTVYSEVRNMWLTCASLTADHASKVLYCGRSVALGHLSLPVDVRSVSVAGKSNTTGHTTVYGLSVKQFDYDQEEQSCAEEIEEKEFNYPRSTARMLTSTQHVMVEAHGGIAFTVAGQ